MYVWSIYAFNIQYIKEIRYSLVVQLVRIPACHAGGRRFESGLDCKIKLINYEHKKHDNGNP